MSNSFALIPRLNIYLVSFLLVIVLAGCVHRAGKKKMVAGVTDITPAQLQKKIQRGGDFILLDVRTPREHVTDHIPDSRLIPLAELAGRSGELDKTKEIVVYCQAGVRSRKASKKLVSLGFTNISNVLGGFAGWQRLKK